MVSSLENVLTRNDNGQNLLANKRNSRISKIASNDTTINRMERIDISNSEYKNSDIEHENKGYGRYPLSQNIKNTK